jgi:hypothetical protein
MRGIKIIDSSKPPDSDSSSDDDEKKLVVKNDINFLNTKVEELMDRQKARGNEISKKWMQILQNGKIADKDGNIIDQEKFEVIKKDL